MESSTLLWVDISARDGPAGMRQALEKSKASTINLYYPEHSESHMDVESFITEAGPHIARWRSLTILARRSPLFWQHALEPLTTEQAPTLESLELKLVGGNHWVYETTVTLFGGAPAPSTLKHLTLTRLPVGVETLTLSGLISLDLARVANISTSQLLKILRNSPCLETLSLVHLAGIGAQASAIQLIDLPKLNSLTLEWIDHGGANCILSTIRVPNRRDVHICTKVGERNAWSTLFTPTIAHILHTSTPNLDPRFSDVIVEVEGRDMCTIRFRGVELALDVGGEDQIHGILTWLAEGLESSEAAECPVRLMVNWTDIDPVRAFLHSSDGTAVQSHEPASSGWLLAQMESLTVIFDTVGSEREFISALRSWWGALVSGNKIASKCPASLRSVELRGPPKVEGLVEEIMEILGKVNVFWADEYVDLEECSS